MGSESSWSSSKVIQSASDSGLWFLGCDYRSSEIWQLTVEERLLWRLRTYKIQDKSMVWLYIRKIYGSIIQPGRRQIGKGGLVSFLWESKRVGEYWWQSFNIILLVRMWSRGNESQTQSQHQYKKSLQKQGPLLLSENDFLKVINLQERYNYYKSVLKLQRLNNCPEQSDESGLLKIIYQLITYYAECISEAEFHKENIILYFQQKMKDLNLHYKTIQEQQAITKNTPPKIDIKKSMIQLGQITSPVTIPIIPLGLTSKTSEQETTKKMKDHHNNSLMAAIQNQNIEEHLSKNMKKVDFLKKSIADSIQHQEEFLNNRLKVKRRKGGLDRQKSETPQSITTMNTLNAQTAIRKLSGVPSKKKKEVCSSFHTTYHSRISSDSELDEAESLYISTFRIDAQDGLDQHA